jgi:aryl-alcohol dehydrogenase-like predicted oxidoreductase
VSASSSATYRHPVHPSAANATSSRPANRASRHRLGLDRLDLLYAHIEDPAVPLAETVEAFAALAAEGTVARHMR